MNTVNIFGFYHPTFGKPISFKMRRQWLAKIGSVCGRGWVAVRFIICHIIRNKGMEASSGPFFVPTMVRQHESRNQE